MFVLNPLPTDDNNKIFINSFCCTLTEIFDIMLEYI